VHGAARVGLPLTSPHPASFQDATLPLQGRVDHCELPQVQRAFRRFGRLMSRLNKYIEVLGEYEGGTLGGMTVKPQEISGRTLHLIVPKGSVTAVQRDVIEAARTRALVANKYPVQIVVTPF
jgi:hypothetical protein